MGRVDQRDAVAAGVRGVEGAIQHVRGQGFLGLDQGLAQVAGIDLTDAGDAVGCQGLEKGDHGLGPAFGGNALEFEGDHRQKFKGR